MPNASRKAKGAPTAPSSAVSGGDTSALWGAVGISCDAFVEKALREGRAHYRDLPWRNIDDPYAVLVSEVMLQQTQVARVRGFWERFLAAFPTIDALAAASTADVLALWQGLGYNRRALALKRAADECALHHAGRLPQTAAELVQLPGIGPATAAGVVAFASNKPALYLETNVRTVFLHEVFPEREKVPDRELMPYIESAATCAFGQVHPRTWYYALLDWGAALKASTPNPSRRSASYHRQSAFQGSHRQRRSIVLRFVLAHSEGVAAARAQEYLAQAESEQGRTLAAGEFERVVAELCREGFIHSAEEEGILFP